MISANASHRILYSYHHYFIYPWYKCHKQLIKDTITSSQISTTSQYVTNHLTIVKAVLANTQVIHCQLVWCHLTTNQAQVNTVIYNSVDSYKNSIYQKLYILMILPSVLWCCRLGSRKGIRPVKTWVVGYWHGYLSGARCRLAYGPADAIATHCLLLQ